MDQPSSWQLDEGGSAATRLKLELFRNLPGRKREPSAPVASEKSIRLTRQLRRIRTWSPSDAIGLLFLRMLWDCFSAPAATTFQHMHDPLMTLQSSALSTPRTSVGRWGSIRFHCSSL